MKEKFIDKTFRAKSLERIEQINKIIAEYKQNGYSLTLRQVYYQLVARDIIPNKQKEYSNLSNLLSDARRAGLVDWWSIEDRTRYLRGWNHYDNPSDALRSTASRYRINLWEGQEHYIEVWCEKDALIGIVSSAASDYDIDSFSCRGYCSDTAMYRAATRFSREAKDGHKPVLLYLGDHDASGIDMGRDIPERLGLFTGKPDMVKFERIALNMEQIEQYRPPVNPAKESDSRYEAYTSKFGTSSWELDALPPEVLTELIHDHIERYMDKVMYDEAIERMQQEKEYLLRIAESLESA